MPKTKQNSAESHWCPNCFPWWNVIDFQWCSHFTVIDTSQLFLFVFLSVQAQVWVTQLQQRQPHPSMIFFVSFWGLNASLLRMCCHSMLLDMSDLIAFEDRQEAPAFQICFAVKPL